MRSLDTEHFESAVAAAVYMELARKPFAEAERRQGNALAVGHNQLAEQAVGQRSSYVVAARTAGGRRHRCRPQCCRTHRDCHRARQRREDLPVPFQA